MRKTLGQIKERRRTLALRDQLLGPDLPSKRHTFRGSQLHAATGVPAHAPEVHTSVHVVASASLQEVPFGWNRSAGHVPEDPVQGSIRFGGSPSAASESKSLQSTSRSTDRGCPKASRYSVSRPQRAARSKMGSIACALGGDPVASRHGGDKALLRGFSRPTTGAVRVGSCGA